MKHNTIYHIYNVINIISITASESVPTYVCVTDGRMQKGWGKEMRKDKECKVREVGLER